MLCLSTVLFLGKIIMYLQTGDRQQRSTTSSGVHKNSSSALNRKVNYTENTDLCVF